MLTSEQTNLLCQQHGVCIVVPTYNNSKTLADLIRGTLKYCRNVIVVNDGSTDNTHDILKEIKDIELISYPVNQGKGSALQTGFGKALEMGFNYAITIDSDGQHNPDDIPVFLEKLEAEGEAMLIGVRNMNQPGIPKKSNFGRRFSNFWFWVETGVKHNDTQSGFRMYPLRKLKKIRLFTRKFEFEIESIVRLAWKGVPVKSVPVTVVYMPAGERVSHFRPFRDFTRISILNTFLVILAYLYFRPLYYLRTFRQKGLKQLISASDPPLKKSLSVAFGVFMGIIPIWGFQLAAAILLAFLLRLNKALVIIFANISIPPFIPVIIYLSMVCGSFWVEHAAPLTSITWPLNRMTVQPYLIQYIAGSITLAIIASIFFGLGAYLILLLRKTNPATSNQ